MTFFLRPLILGQTPTKTSRKDSSTISVAIVEKLCRVKITANVDPVDLAR
jgi:hypothetical protein